MSVSRLSLKFVFVIFREPLVLNFTRIAVISSGSRARISS